MQCLLVQQPDTLLGRYGSGSITAHVQNMITLGKLTMAAFDYGGMASCTIEVGDKFISFEELKSKITAYEKGKSVQLLQKDSRTLAAAMKRALRKVEKANKTLIYYSITFCCAFGGKDYKCKSSGKRVHQRLASVDF